MESLHNYVNSVVSLIWIEHEMEHGQKQNLAMDIAFDESVRCLTWNAPSAKHLLPLDLRERADNGEFKDRIVSIVRGSDTIGYGPFGPYDGHIGSTYAVTPPARSVFLYLNQYVITCSLENQPSLLYLSDFPKC